MPAEGFAIYGAVNTTYGLIKEIYGYIEKFAKADSRAESIKLKFSTTQPQVLVFVEFFSENKQHIAPDHADSIIAASDKLKGTLGNIRNKIKKYDPKTWHRIQWPWVEKPLIEAEKSLQEWVASLSTTFMLLPDALKQKMARKMVSFEYQTETYPLAALMTHIEMRQKQIDLKSIGRVKLLQSATREPQDNDVAISFYWKDLIWIPPHIRTNKSDLEDFKIEVAKLVEVLKGARSKLTYIPKAHSWFQRSDDTLGIAYNVPASTCIQSGLREKTNTLKDAVGKPIQHTLTSRLELAVQIASAVCYVHGLEWVHKTIRSSNILLITDKGTTDSPSSLGRANLKGFRIARRGTKDARSTDVERENKLGWENQIYSHPRRQLIHIVEEEQLFYDAYEYTTQASLAATRNEHLTPYVPNAGHPSLNAENDVPWDAEPKREFYKYKHDIYSVGVVLLELGMWESLTVDDTLKRLTPDERKSKLQSIADEKLGVRMGERYLTVVKSCLNVDDSKWDIQRVLSELSDIKI